MAKLVFRQLHLVQVGLCKCNIVKRTRNFREEDMGSQAVWIAFDCQDIKAIVENKTSSLITMVMVTQMYPYDPCSNLY